MKRSKYFAYLLLLVVAVSSTSNGSALPYENSKTCKQEEVATNKVSVWSCLSKKSKEIIYKEIKDRLNLNTIMLKIGGFDGRYYPAEVILTISRYQRYNFKD